MRRFRALLTAVAVAGVLVPGLVTTMPASPAHASVSCGSWRWPVKTGADATRWRVSAKVRHTTVGYLDRLRKPSHFGSYARNHRIKWPEFKTWQVKATLIAVKLESDGDYHLRLRERRHNMVAEIPRPACVSSRSRWKRQIRAARSWINARYSVSSHYWHYVHRKVKIRGLGFFDEEHHVTGAAPNQIELHPVIRIRYA